MNFKHYFVLGFLTIFFVASCKKQEKTPPALTEEAGDNIHFIDLVPDTNLTTVSTWYQVPNPFGNPYILPTPMDSFCSLVISLGPVISKNITFYLNHYYSFTSPHAGIGNYNFNAILSGSDSLISFTGGVKESEGMSPAYEYPSYIPKDSLISYQKNYCFQPSFYKHGNIYRLAYYGEFGDKYIGFRVKHKTHFGNFVGNNLYYYGWILVSRSAMAQLTIKELAINQIWNRPIRAGQKQ